jgi:hypothetical protein
VSTAPQAATQATAIKKVLDNVLRLTASPGSASLPAGLLALPASLTSKAEADIANDIVALPPTGGKKPGGGGGSGGGSTHHSGGGSQTGSSGNGSSPGGSQTSGGSTGGGGGQSSSSPTPAKNLDAHTSSANGKPGHLTNGNSRSPRPSRGIFHALQVALAAPEWRWLLGAMLIVGVIAIGTGPLLLLARRLRRRLATLRGRT